MLPAINPIALSQNFITCQMAVFHLAISNMAQRHVAFCERHVALQPVQVRHAALQVRHVAFQIFRQ